jgi:hypothetical protein
MSKYILFVFASMEDQEKLIEIISNDIKALSENGSVKSFYGDQAAIFTFDSLLNNEAVQDYFSVIYDIADRVYFVFKFVPEQIGYYLPPHIEKYLLETDKMSEISDNIVKENNQEQNLLFSDEKEFESQLNDYGCGDIPFIKVRGEKEPSLDDLLDKISKTGLDSLTLKEKKILNNYSK